MILSVDRYRKLKIAQNKERKSHTFPLSVVSCAHDAVIRVYDEAGNVIEGARWRFQRVVSPDMFTKRLTALRIVIEKRCEDFAGCVQYSMSLIVLS